MELDTIYRVPLAYHEVGLDTQVLKVFGIENAPEPDLSRWKNVVERVKNPEGESALPWSAIHAGQGQLQIAVRGADPWRAGQQFEGPSDWIDSEVSSPGRGGLSGKMPWQLCRRVPASAAPKARSGL